MPSLQITVRRFGEISNKISAYYSEGDVFLCLLQDGPAVCLRWVRAELSAQARFHAVKGSSKRASGMQRPSPGRQHGAGERPGFQSQRVLAPILALPLPKWVMGLDFGMLTELWL